MNLETSLMKERVSQILNSEQNEGQSFLDACNKIWLLLDDMKKDYPIWNNSDIEAKLTADVLFNLVKAKDKWAKKWLGTNNGENDGNCEF